MSWDRKTRQLIARQHMSRVLEYESSRIRKEKEQKEMMEYKSSDDYKKNLIRRELQKNLTKANKCLPERKIQNTLTFYNDTVKSLENEYKELCLNKNNNMLERISMIKGYAAHIKILRKFDEETELNPELGYDEKLAIKFEKFVQTLNPELVKFAQLSTIELLSL